MGMKWHNRETTIAVLDRSGLTSIETVILTALLDRPCDPNEQLSYTTSAPLQNPCTKS